MKTNVWVAVYKFGTWRMTNSYDVSPTDKVNLVNSYFDSQTNNLVSCGWFVPVLFS